MRGYNNPYGYPQGSPYAYPYAYPYNGRMGAAYPQAQCGCGAYPADGITYPFAPPAADPYRAAALAVCDPRQRHVHEIQGTVRQSSGGCVGAHTHHYAAVSGQAIPGNDGSHTHEIFFRTDYAGHFHEFRGRSGPAVGVGAGGKHTHYISSVTTTDERHRHGFETSVLINNPLEK